MAYIHSIFNKLKNEENSMVVFDIDSTIMNTAPRNYRILLEASESYPSLKKAVEKLSVCNMGWNIVDDLKSVGFKEEKILYSVKEFWAEKFFTDEYVLYDEPYEGAVDFVNRVRKTGAFLYYLTGRDVPNMKKGTVESFKKHNLPVDKGVEFHLKPDFNVPDLKFKKEALRDIKSHKKRVVAIFENEPANANLFKKNFPESDVFCINTITSPNPEALRDDILIFDSWKK